MELVKFLSSFLAGAVLLDGARAQTARCATSSAYCNSGSSFDAAVNGVVAKFRDGNFYGGTAPITFGSALSGSGLAEVSYSCLDGSVPPPLSGSSIRTSLAKIKSCPNRCGSLAVSAEGKCGLAMMTVADAANDVCFSKAINVDPQGRPPPVAQPARGYNPRGCVSDADGSTLTAGFADEPDMTIATCLGLAHGYHYAGLVGGSSCYWGNKLGPNAVPLSSNKCDQACPGQAAAIEICGGNGTMSVYESQDGPDVPILVPSAGTYTHLDCFSDAGSNRVLNICSLGLPNMTVEMCASLATTFRYFGVEAGQTCCFSDAIAGPRAASEDSCEASACQGDSGEFCGGTDSILVYEDTEWRSLSAAQLADLILDYEQLALDFWRLLEALQALLTPTPARRRVKRQLSDDIGIFTGLISDLFPREVLNLGRLAKAMDIGMREAQIDNLLGGRDGRVYVRQAGNNINGTLANLLAASDEISNGTPKGLAAVNRGIAALGTPPVNGKAAQGAFSDLSFVYQLLAGSQPQLSIPNPGGATLQPCTADNCINRGLCTTNSKRSEDGLLGLISRFSKRIPTPARPDDVEDVTDQQIQQVRQAHALTPSDSTDRLLWWRVVKSLAWNGGAHHGITQQMNEVASSAILRFEHDQLAVTGAGPVYGCTNVLVLSPQGVWLAHFWQSFFNDQTTYTTSVRPLLAGPTVAGAEYPALHDFTNVGGPFNQQPWVQAVIMYPRERYEHQNDRIVDMTADLVRELRLGQPSFTAANVQTVTYDYDFDIWFPLYPELVPFWPADGPPMHYYLNRTIRRTTQPGRGWLTVLQFGSKVVVNVEGNKFIEMDGLPFLPLPKKRSDPDNALAMKSARRSVVGLVKHWFGARAIGERGGRPKVWSMNASIVG